MWSLIRDVVLVSDDKGSCNMDLSSSPCAQMLDYRRKFSEQKTHHLTILSYYL
jgi:hypothetical protein